MMFWHDHDVSGWGWFAVSAGMILFWALIITAAVLFFRALNHAPEQPPSPPAPRPSNRSPSGSPAVT
ncbi:hypothetical protein [Streptomyces fildesensis]|uniref:hypothetical protein n=1 Tax=Streptomyces fildesensis TaxID=375757 RepID=UPI002684C5D3|nr:hypothetical protein [Streptomyces fildesensis]